MEIKVRKNNGKKIIADCETKVITSFEENNAMRQCIVRKILFLEKRFRTMHTNNSTEPDDVVEASVHIVKVK